MKSRMPFLAWNITKDLAKMFFTMFYQKFRKVIKGDLMQMFQSLHNGDFPLFSLNFGVIILIPKVLEARQMQ